MTSLPARAERGLTREVRALVTEAGRRRLLLPRAYVGEPGHERVRIAAVPADLAPDVDAGLRADLVERAVDGLLEVARPVVWVTRSGELDVTDDDLAWLTAARAGLARHGLGLPAFLLLNRYGWRDVLGGRSRTWTRLRPLPRVPAPHAWDLPVEELPVY